MRSGTWRSAQDLFEAVHDERGVAASHDDIGKLLWLKGEYDKALEEMKRLARDAQEARRPPLHRTQPEQHRAGVDGSRARRKAGEALEAALTIRREIGDPLGIVQSLNNLGQLAQDQENGQKALELFREAYDVAREIGERNRIAVVLTNIGETHYRLGDSAAGHPHPEAKPRSCATSSATGCTWRRRSAASPRRT